MVTAFLLHTGFDFTIATDSGQQLIIYMLEISNIAYNNCKYKEWGRCDLIMGKGQLLLQDKE